jgi:hypothetical protein
MCGIFFEINASPQLLVWVLHRRVRHGVGTAATAQSLGYKSQVELTQIYGM